MKKRYMLPILLGLVIVADVTQAWADYSCVATCMCRDDLRESIGSCQGRSEKLAKDCAAQAACSHCPTPQDGMVTKLDCDPVSSVPPLPIEEFW